MTPSQPRILLEKSADYRENYANSVQIRVNLWDFFLMFGHINQTSQDNVQIQNFQGVWVSPQQAKALLNVLQQNVSGVSLDQETVNMLQQQRTYQGAAMFISTVNQMMQSLLNITL